MAAREPFLRQLSQPMSGQKWSARIKSRALAQPTIIYSHKNTFEADDGDSDGRREMHWHWTARAAELEIDGWMDGFFQAVVQKDAALMCASALSRAGFFRANTCKGIVTQ
jgi:hypothetical protein